MSKTKKYRCAVCNKKMREPVNTIDIHKTVFGVRVGVAIVTIDFCSFACTEHFMLHDPITEEHYRQCSRQELNRDV